MGWLQREWPDVRPQLKYDIYKWIVLGAGGLVITLGALVLRGLQVQMQKIPEVYFYGTLFMISCVCLWFLGNRLGRIPGLAKSQVQTEKPVQKEQDAPVTSPSMASDFGQVDQFYRTYDNRLLVEVEDFVRGSLSKYPVNDHPRMLARLFASSFIMYTFELTWLLIYASQLDALHDLNSGPLKRKQLRPYYDAVAQKFPDAYRQYSFDGWLGFMRTLVLIREDGDMVSLTIRGQEFLKYLIHTQRSAKGRPY